MSDNHDLDYTEGTVGWCQYLVPFWTNLLKKQDVIIQQEERKVISGKESKVAYELGVKDGMHMAIDAPKSLRMGVKSWKSLLGVKE